MYDYLMINGMLSSADTHLGGIFSGKSTSTTSRHILISHFNRLFASFYASCLP